MNKCFGINWALATPLMIVALLLCMIGIVFLWFRWRWVYQQIGSLFGSPQMRHLIEHFSHQRLRIKLVLVGVAVVLIMLGIMRPQWDYANEEVIQEGRDVVIALDVSRSMLAQDIVPNRLCCAQEKIRSLVNRLQADRVALVIFSRDAVVQCPLTRDHGAFFLFLNEIDATTISTASTDLGSALAKSVSVLSKNGSSRNKIVLMVTDGEDFSEDLAQQAERARADGIALCVLGVGTKDGAPIPVFDAEGNQNGYQRDESGTIVITSYDETTIQRLLQTCGGQHVQCVPGSNTDINDVYQWIARFEKEQRGMQQMKQLREQYQWFIGGALVALLLELFL